MPFLKTRFLSGQLGMVRNRKLLGHHNGLTSPDVGPRGRNASCALSLAKSKCFPSIPCPPDSAVSLRSHCNSSPNPTSPALLPNKPPSTYLHRASHVHFTNLLLGSSHSFTLTLPYYASQVKSSFYCIHCPWDLSIPLLIMRCTWQSPLPGLEDPWAQKP